MKQVAQRILTAIQKIFLTNGKLRTAVVPVALILVLLLFTGMGIKELAGAFRYNKTDITEEEAELGILDMDVPEGITNIALFGIDSRDDDFKGLSDSIMIITVDSVHNDIKLTSIMRDSLVRVDGYGHQKINAAYSLGGAQLAIKTLNQTFNLNITDYATVDFVSMGDIIEAVGGIEAELTSAEVWQANKQIREMARTRGMKKDEIRQPGKQTLNGVQAVAYARIRKTATINGTWDDKGRTERQRLVMRQLFEKALAMEVNKYPAMIRAMLPCMETSLDYGEIFELAGMLTSDGVTLKEARVPSDEMFIQYGMNVQGLGSCAYYNLDYAARILNAFIFEDISFADYIAVNGVDRTPWFTGTVISNTEEEETETETPEEEVSPDTQTETEETTPDTETNGEETTPETETSEGEVSPDTQTGTEETTPDTETEEEETTPETETPEEEVPPVTETPDTETTPQPETPAGGNETPDIGDGAGTGKTEPGSEGTVA